MGSFIYLCLLQMRWSLNCQKYLMPAEYSIKSVPVWARYLSASERSYLAIFEIIVNY